MNNDHKISLIEDKEEDNLKNLFSIIAKDLYRRPDPWCSLSIDIIAKSIDEYFDTQEYPKIICLLTVILTEILCAFPNVLIKEVLEYLLNDVTSLYDNTAKEKQKFNQFSAQLFEYFEKVIDQIEESDRETGVRSTYGCSDQDNDWNSRFTLKELTQNIHRLIRAPIDCGYHMQKIGVYLTQPVWKIEETKGHRVASSSNYDSITTKTFTELFESKSGHCLPQPIQEYINSLTDYDYVKYIGILKTCASIKNLTFMLSPTALTTLCTILMIQPPVSASNMSNKLLTFLGISSKLPEESRKDLIIKSLGLLHIKPRTFKITADGGCELQLGLLDRLNLRCIYENRYFFEIISSFMYTILKELKLCPVLSIEYCFEKTDSDQKKIDAIKIASDLIKCLLWNSLSKNKQLLTDQLKPICQRYIHNSEYMDRRLTPVFGKILPFFGTSLQKLARELENKTHTPYSFS